VRAADGGLATFRRKNREPSRLGLRIAEAARGDDFGCDGFSSSVQRIGPLAPKITVVTATNDRALAVSRWIAGGITRVGAAEKAQLERIGIRVIDASQLGWGIINHDLFLSNVQIRKVIREAVDGQPGSAPGLTWRERAGPSMFCGFLSA